VQALADRAVEAFGRIDVWLDNAGASVLGRFTEIPSDDWRQVIEVDLFGTANGASAAMRQFQRQGGGILINNSSIVGRTAKPDSSAYATAKFAIRGLGEALRQEALLYERSIHVCTILPSVIDTPFFHHAANYSGRRLRAAPPVYTAEKVARTVVSLARRPRAEVVIGGAGRTATILERLAPPLMRRINAPALHRGFLAPEPGPETEGGVFEPVRDGRTVSGGWRKGVNDGGVPSALIGLAALAIGAFAWRRRASADERRPAARYAAGR